MHDLWSRWLGLVPVGVVTGVSTQSLQTGPGTGKTSNSLFTAEILRGTGGSMSLYKAGQELRRGDDDCHRDFYTWTVYHGQWPKDRSEVRKDPTSKLLPTRGPLDLCHSSVCSSFLHSKKTKPNFVNEFALSVFSIPKVTRNCFTKVPLVRTYDILVICLCFTRGFPFLKRILFWRRGVCWFLRQVFGERHERMRGLK